MFQKAIKPTQDQKQFPCHQPKFLTLFVYSGTKSDQNVNDSGASIEKSETLKKLQLACKAIIR